MRNYDDVCQGPAEDCNVCDYRSDCTNFCGNKIFLK